jgi:DNA repair photolyase
MPLTTGEPWRGRGASVNPANRFERIAYEPDPDVPEEEQSAPATVFYRDTSRSLIATNDSPDVGFDASINPYRGCEHGCAYCYARPYHEYLGFSSGIDFETKIMVKEEAPALLRKELMSPKWRPQVLAMSGVTDCYQPIERKLQLTRRCLEVLAEFRNPVGIVTKNRLVTRDIDVLQELAKYDAAGVAISLNSLDGELARKLEPRATQPAGRLAAMEELSKAGIPVTVLVAPVIPGLNDHEVLPVLSAAADAGARGAGYVMLRLPYAVKEVFVAWLDQHFPERKEKVLSRIREVRSGQMSDPRFGTRMRGEGIFADTVEQLFELGCRRAGLNRKHRDLTTEHFRRPGGQKELFA